MLNGPRHGDLLDRATSALLVVDLQEAFRGHVAGFAALEAQVVVLVTAARRLGIPLARSEQYPRGLGATVPAVVEAMGDAALSFDKLAFDATATSGWDGLPSEVRHARQLVVVGIEAHVCVRHTVLGLLAASRQVHVPADAVGSRTTEHRDMALSSLARAGAHVGSVEQVVFDWLGAAGTPEFRDVQGLLKP